MMARLRFLVVLAGLLMPPFCRAQVTGTFSLEKVAFAPGEPVFLTLRNEGKDAVEVQTAPDPFHVLLGIYDPYLPGCNPGTGLLRESRCYLWVGRDPPRTGESRSERLLLNYKRNSLEEELFGRSPGSGRGSGRLHGGGFA
jgi:hypothetical protein